MQLTAIQYLNTAMVLIWTNYTVQNDIFTDIPPFTVGLVIGFRTYRTHMENMSESNIKKQTFVIVSVYNQFLKCDQSKSAS